TSIAGQNIDEGDTLSIPNMGSITQSSSDPNHSWGYTVDWGDGDLPDSGTATVDVPGASAHFNGTHSYAIDGTYTVTVRVLDNLGLSATQTFTVTVNEVSPTLEDFTVDSPVNEGDPVDLGPVAFRDPDTRDTHTATIAWGDGTTDAGTVAQAPDRDGSTVGYTTFPEHVYSKEGHYTVTVSVMEQNGQSDTKTADVDVNEVNPAIDVFTIAPANEGDKVNVGTVTFHDKGSSDTHTATIDWGDGSSKDTAT